jgi:uncharacterized protein involved in exopolysaccharide biosynthesis
LKHLSQATLDGPDNQDLANSDSVLEDDQLDQESGESQLLPRLRILWARRLILAKATAWALLIGFVVSWLIPDTYEASVQLMPPDSSSLSGSSAMLGLLMGAGGLGGGSSSGSSSSAGGLAGTVGDLLGAQKPGALFIGILNCRTLADRMIDRFDLRGVYWVKTYMAARKKLSSRVVFQEDKKSGIIRITVEDRNRARSTAMAQAYVEELNALLARVNTSAASREREFLEKRLTAVNGELQDATKTLSEFSSRNAILDPQDQGKAMLDSAAILEGQLIAARSELSGLQEIYTSENVRVRSLQAHIDALQKQLNAFGGKDYSGATTLDQNALYPSVRQLPVLGREYLNLYRTAKIDETVYELLTESYEMAKVQEAKETPSVKVLDAARLPERKSWPPRFLLTLAAALLGLILTSVWTLATKSWSEGDPNEPSRLFIAEVLLDAKRDWRKFRSRGNPPVKLQSDLNSNV